MVEILQHRHLCATPLMLCYAQALGPPILWSRDRLATYCNQEKYDQFCAFVAKRTEYYKYIWEQITHPLITALPSVRSPLARRCTSSTALHAARACHLVSCAHARRAVLSPSDLQVFGERGRYFKYEDYAWALSAVLSRMWCDTLSYIQHPTLYTLHLTQHPAPCAVHPTPAPTPEAQRHDPLTLLPTHEPQTPCAVQEHARRRRGRVSQQRHAHRSRFHPASTLLPAARFLSRLADERAAKSQASASSSFRFWAAFLAGA